MPASYSASEVRPRIAYTGRYWRCLGRGAIGRGGSPAEAYRAWLVRFRIALVQLGML